MGYYRRMSDSFGVNRRSPAAGAAGAAAAVMLILALAEPCDANPPAPACLTAVVSPVSGFAECVNPRGAPVDPPPQRPAPSRETCRKHKDLSVDACRPSAGAPAK